MAADDRLHVGGKRSAFRAQTMLVGPRDQVKRSQQRRASEDRRPTGSLHRGSFRRRPNPRGRRMKDAARVALALGGLGALGVAAVRTLRRRR
jgi:hypothetical protein